MAVPSSPLISFPLEPASWAAAVDLLWSLGARPRIPEPLERIRDVRNVRTWQLEKGMLALNFRAPDGSVEVDLWHSTTAAAARGWPNASSPAAFAKFRGRIKTTFGIGTNLTNDLGPAALSIVVKPVEAGGFPVGKLSDDPSKDTGHPAEMDRIRRLIRRSWRNSRLNDSSSGRGGQIGRAHV